MRADPLWCSESVSLEVMRRRQLFDLDWYPLVTFVSSQVTIFAGVSCAMSPIEPPLVLQSGGQGAFNLIDDLSADVG
jgi:hypothetical protein